MIPSFSLNVNKVCVTQEKDLTFRAILGMIEADIRPGLRGRVRRNLSVGKDEIFMKNMNKLFAIIGCVTAVIAAIVAVAAVLNHLEKKKEDAELEEYLEAAIQ